jgi:hypothetical protein
MLNGMYGGVRGRRLVTASYSIANKYFAIMAKHANAKSGDLT